MLTVEQACAIALSYPEVEQGTYRSQPSFTVQKKFIGRVFDDGEAFVLRCKEPERGFLLESQPETYFVMPHFAGWPYILVRLAQMDEDQFRYLYEKSWRIGAPKSVVKAWDEGKG